MEFIEIGKIVNTFGIKGEVKSESYTDFEEERYKKGSTVYIGEEKIPLQVNYFKHHKGFTLIQFKDHEDINLIEKYKGKIIYKSKDDIRPLEDGKYYFSDLETLKVFQGEKEVGESLGCEEGIKYNFLRIRKNDGKEVLIPFLKQFIVNVDLKERRIEIVKMEGLL